MKRNILHCLLGLYFGLLLSAMTGCQSDASSREATAAHPARSRDAVALPPGLGSTQVSPHRDEALTRAGMTLEQIVADLPKPAFITEARDVDDAVPTVDLPLAAQRAYVAGRLAMLENRGYDAIQYLSAVDRMAPNHPQILRLLGMAYLQSGVRVRGAHYLGQVVRLEPHDVASLYYLGRHAIEQGNWPQAVATFARALELRPRLKNADPGIWPLIHFYLGSALERDRYDEAALEQFRSFLTLSFSQGENTRFMNELRLLSRQASPTWLAVGDIHCRMNRPAEALEAYRRAQSHLPADDLGLLRRLVYVQLRLGRAQESAATLRRALGRDVSQPLLELVSYLRSEGVDTASLAERLHELYLADHRPAQLALTIADLLPRAEARDLLDSHLAHEPDNQAVFVRALDLLLSASSPDTVAAVVLTDALRRKVSPRLAQQYVADLFARVDDPQRVLTAIDQTDESRQSQLRFLRAQALNRMERDEEAQRVYESLLSDAIDGHSARVEMVHLLIERESYDEALALIEAAAQQDDPQLLLLHVRVLTRLDRLSDAMDLIDRAIAAQPDNVELPMQKAQVQLDHGDMAGAERTLVAALNHRPDVEPLYLKLREIYLTRQLPDWEMRQSWLNEKALRTIPDSRMAKLVQVDQHLANRQIDAAVRLLRELLAEQPDDERTFGTLIGIYLAAQRHEDGHQLIQAQLDRYPDDQQWVQLAGYFYSESGQWRRLAELLERMLSRRMSDDPVVTVRQYIMAMRQIEAAEEADAFIQRIAEAYPDRAAEMTYYRVSLFMSDDPARAESILEEVLRVDPKHVAANNDLGYIWSDRGVHLERALEMVQYAVEQDPTNANFRDSLGWVYYKLGRFEEAIAELRRAVEDPAGGNPIITEHLGDALHRAGREQEAADAWRRALGELAEIQRFDARLMDDPEMRDCARRVREKLAEIEAGRRPVTATVPAVDDESQAP